MKTVHLLLVALCASVGATADDDYSHTVYTATAFMYWCAYGKVPAGVDDFARVTDVNDPDPRITLSPEDWFRSVRFEVNGDQLRVVRDRREGGAVQHSAVSTSNCGSFKVLERPPGQAPRPTR